METSSVSPERAETTAPQPADAAASSAAFVSVTVPAWSSSDKVLRIKGKGLARKGGGHGDLLVHVRIMLPEGGDPALEAFLRESVAKQA